jgi:cyclic beta-1,2-glucan synthetase
MLDWIALNRWSDDALDHCQGFFLYLQDQDDGEVWSPAWQPVEAEDGVFLFVARPGQIELDHDHNQIEASMEVRVDPVDDVESRRLTLRNVSAHVKCLEITSCIEVALAHPMGDLSHPTFSKLFVQTELDAGSSALIAKRRPRSQGESWPAIFHALSGAPTLAWETDRLKFIGRGRCLTYPLMRMEGTVGNVLDPLMSLRTRVEIQPGESHEMVFILGASFDHDQVETLVKKHAPAAALEPSGMMESEELSLVSGGFDESGRSYRIHLPWLNGELGLPPMPWCNVMANERIGCLVSERGAGCTWSRNSQANRLTPWSNDPVMDPHHEALYLREGERCWSPLPGPVPAGVGCDVVHGIGWSTWEQTSHDLRQKTRMFVAPSDPVKITILSLTNDSNVTRRVTLMAYNRVVLGTLPRPAGEVRTWFDESGVLCAQRSKEDDFSSGIAFLGWVFAEDHLTSASFTTDRRSFLGAAGCLFKPEGLCREGLDGRVGEDVDPCFAWSWELEIAPDQTVQCAMLLGEALGQDELQELAQRYLQWDGVLAAWEGSQAFWEQILSRIKVVSPSPEIDHMVNGWLAYQSLVCRIWGRTAFYQSSGAFGFRDQLQDVGNLTLLWPGLARRQILLHAAHQFEEGDVLHWWHDAPVERGVRTRFSDDLLWLPFVTESYVRSTGDQSILDEIMPFLKAPLLEPGEDENYLKPEVSDESASLYEHCCRALDRSLTRGSHGLPLMGTGDWNDGMNRVGREGRGESVWLGFFIYDILGHFIPIVQKRGDQREGRYAAYRETLHLALNAGGWDGGWYRRAYYDNGTALGTHSASECRIDGLAQAWSVLSGAAPEKRGIQAMNAAEQQLINESEGLIRLLTPPFVECEEDPGYIKGYVAGVRENGGQYTHSACWMVAALAKLGRRDRAVRCLEMISPLWHTQDELETGRYKVEPYVIAADVYGAAPHIGRGGWTWYTGSAGWAFRVAIESVLGLRIENGEMLVVAPCVPDDWTAYRVEYRHPGSEAQFIIDVENPTGCAECVTLVEVDGLSLPVADGEARMPIPSSGGRFEVRITLGVKAG